MLRVSIKQQQKAETPLMTTITNREFNRNVCRAKRAAASGPVVITNRGSEAFVLMTWSDYQRITEARKAAARKPRKQTQGS